MECGWFKQLKQESAFICIANFTQCFGFSWSIDISSSKSSLHSITQDSFQLWVASLPDMSLGSRTQLHCIASIPSVATTSARLLALPPPSLVIYKQVSHETFPTIDFWQRWGAGSWMPLVNDSKCNFLCEETWNQPSHYISSRSISQERLGGYPMSRLVIIPSRHVCSPHSPIPKKLPFPMLPVGFYNYCLGLDTHYNGNWKHRDWLSLLPRQSLAWSQPWSMANWKLSGISFWVSPHPITHLL